MKPLTALILAFLFAVTAAISASAQSAESIWLTANTSAYKTGETVIVSVYGSSATPVQGFTFQIRYDAACLKPVNAASTIPGMNGLPLPQLSGLVDGSYASTTPQTVNGVLAEVRFEALKGCQTDLTLESAALAIRNEAGFAAPLAGVTLSQTKIAVAIGNEVAESQVEVPVTGALLPLAPAEVHTTPNYSWVMALLVVIFVLGCMFLVFRYFQLGNYGPRSNSSAASAMLHVKHGPYAGQSFVLNKLPCTIGRDPRNEICLDDPHVVGRHARIFAENDAYYLMDFSGNTFINGQAVRKTSVALKPGDVVRLGKSALFVFGS
jgi:hypothetical protein